MKHVQILAGVALAALVLVPGCGQQNSNDPVLAKVGPRVIHASDYVDAYTAMAPANRPDLTEADARRSFLKDMVNKDLMELSASERYPSLVMQQQWRLKRYRETQLTQMVKKRLIDDVVHVTEAMKDSLYENMKEQRHVLAMRINDAAEADYVRKQVDAGEDWGTLTYDHSVLWTNNHPPGDLGWLDAGTFTWPLDRKIWEAPVGVTLGPLHEARGNFIVRVLDTRPKTDLKSREELDGTLQEDIYGPMFLDRQQVVQDSLRAAADPYFPAAGKALIMAKYYWEPAQSEVENPYAKLDAQRTTPDFSAAEESVKVVVFKNAPDWDLKEFARRLEWMPAGIWPTGQSEAELDDLYRIMIRDYLYLKAARDMDLDHSPEFLDAAERQANQMRVTYFYYNDLMRGINPTDADIQAYFDANRDRYKAPPSFKVAYFSSKDGAAMKQLAEDWQNGASFMDLKAKYSARIDSLESNGETPWIYEQRDPVLDQVVQPMKEGDVSDPMVRADVSTVFRLITRRSERLLNYPEVKSQVDQDAKAQMSDDKLNTFLEGQRKKFGVKVYEDALAKVEIPADQPAPEGQQASRSREIQ